MTSETTNDKEAKKLLMDELIENEWDFTKQRDN